MIADQAASEVRVAVDCASNCARCARPRFEARGRVADHPTDEAVDCDGGVRDYPSFVHAMDLAGARPDDQSAHASIGDKHIRAAAEQRHRDATVAGEVEGERNLAAVACFEQPVCRAADAKRRERRERGMFSNAIGCEMSPQRGAEGHGRLSSAINARSWAMSAAIASRAEHSEKEILSPGPS